MTSVFTTSRPILTRPRSLKVLMRLQKNIMPSNFSVSLKIPQNAKQIFFSQSRSRTTSTSPTASTSENTK